MTKERQAQMLKKVVAKEAIRRKFDEQLIDLEAHIDGSLSYLENKAHIIELIDGIAPNPDINTDRLHAEQIEAIEQEEEHYIAEQGKAINELSEATPNLDRFFLTPINLVTMLVQGYGHAVMFEGAQGIGKTITILRTLKAQGLELGRDFAYKRGYTTPLAFVEFLYAHKDKQIIVIDDCEGIFIDERGKSIMKCLLDNSLGKRFVDYTSTARRAEQTPTPFEVTARIISCANQYPQDIDFKAVMDRCMFYEVEFSYRELVEILKELAKLPYRDMGMEQRQAVMKFIMENSNEATENLSLRSLFKLYDIFLYTKGAGDLWNSMAQDILKPNPIMVLVRQLDRSGLSVSQQAHEFMEKTAMSRTTFYRIRAKLRNKSQSPTQ